MQFYAYQAMLRNSRIVIRKPIKDGMAEFLLVERAWEDKHGILQGGF